MKKKQAIKFFTVLFITTLFLFSFSHFGSLALKAMTTDEELFLDGTTIASVDVSGNSKDEALSLLAEQLQYWISETSYKLIYKEKEIPLETVVFEFEVEKSIQNAQNGQENPLLVSISEDELQSTLVSLSSQLLLTEEQIDQLMNELINTAQLLKTGSHNINIEDYLDTEEANEIVNETSIELNGVSVEMADWVQAISPITVPAQSQISLLNTLEDRDLLNIPIETMSMIASAIYQTIIPSNFTVIERHLGQEVPTYIQLGFEARVSREHHLDFSFENPSKFEYQLELSWEYPTLTVQLKGIPMLYQYKVEFADEQKYKPKTIVQYSPQLRPTETKVLKNGKTGSRIKVLRKVFDEREQFLYEEVISEDYYAPIERIEVRGLQTNNSFSENPDPNNPINSNINTNTDNESSDNTSESTGHPDTEEEGVTTNNDGKPDEKTRQKEEKEFWGKPNELEK